MDRQSELKKAQEDYERTLLRLDESWCSRIVDFGKETERLQKEHQKETERLRLEFISRWKPDLFESGAQNPGSQVDPVSGPVTGNWNRGQDQERHPNPNQEANSVPAPIPGPLQDDDG